MSNMILGAYTFALNPFRMSPVKADRAVAAVPTYSGAEVISWGPQLAGTKLALEWGRMTESMWDNLKTLEANDVGVVFDPKVTSGKTFNVEILSLTGMLGNIYSGSEAFVENVNLQLMIVSEVT